MASNNQDLQLKITGYSDRFSVRPGDEIKFYVHSERGEAFQADIVRLIHGDTNPEGPGLKEELIHSPISDMHPGKNQPIHAGSYIFVPHNDLMNLSSFTMCAYIYPTTPYVDVEGVEVGVQAIMTKWDAENETGYGLFINSDGELCLRIGRGKSKVEEFSTGKPLFRKIWYKIGASYDASTGKVRVFQSPYVTHTNGGHGMSMLHPRNDTEGEYNGSSLMGSAPANDCPFLIGASTKKTKSGRSIFGGHFKHLESPEEIPEHTQKYNGKVERPKLVNRALDKSEIETLLSNQGIEYVSNDLRDAVIGAWDFAANIEPNAASTLIIDKSLCKLNGSAINMPIRGVPGFNWSSDYMSFLHGPHEYGAVHFHDESVDDARWDESFKFTVPDNLPSGVYAARLRVNRLTDAENEDYIPFFVRPPKEGSKAKIALIIPTNSYMAYANDNLSVNSVVAQLLTGRVPLLQPSDLLLNDYRGYGLGTYTVYRDGWGVNISSRLRPILNMRPKYIHILSPSLWQLNADLHFVDWLHEMNFDVDIHTDEDIQKEGVELLKKYKVVMTGHHPEYITEEAWHAFHDYQMQGGRFMYNAANGYYWICALHPDNHNILEVRKGDNGTRAWTINPGEYCNAFDGKHGGLWRVRGRDMCKLLGVSFTSFGLTYSSYYKRSPDSELSECAWMFEGIGLDEPIGDFGLIGDGAAGLELDRYDLEKGTPHRAFVLAHSEGHNDMFVTVSEDSTFHARGNILNGTGETNPNTRADILYYKTPNDGAVISFSSMTWLGSLSHNKYDNNVSRLMKNVITGFMKDGPLP